MQNRVIEITYLYWEKFFVMENGKCHLLAYPMTNAADISRLEPANG